MYNPFINKVKRSNHYGLYGVINDGTVLCPTCILKHEEEIEKASENIMYEGYDQSGWFLLGTMVNEDNHQLSCSHCSSRIDMKKDEDRARTERGHFSKNEDTSQPNEVKFFPWVRAKLNLIIRVRLVEVSSLSSWGHFEDTSQFPSIPDGIWARRELRTERTLFFINYAYRNILCFIIHVFIYENILFKKVSSLSFVSSPQKFIENPIHL